MTKTLHLAILTLVGLLWSLTALAYLHPGTYVAAIPLTPAGSWTGIAGSGGAPPAFSRQAITAIATDSSASNCGGTGGCVALMVAATSGIGSVGTTANVFVSGVNTHTEADGGALGYVVSSTQIDMQGIAYNASGGTYMPTAPNWALVSLARGSQQITGIGQGSTTLTAAGGPAVRLTMASTAGLNTGDMQTVSNAPVPEANGTWPITVVDSTHVDLGVVANPTLTEYGPTLTSCTSACSAGGLLLYAEAAGAGIDDYSNVDMTSSPWFVACGATIGNRHGIAQVNGYYEGSSGIATQQFQNGGLNNLASWKGTDGYVFGLYTPGTHSGIADFYCDAIPVMGFDRRASIHTWIDIGNSKTGKYVTATTSADASTCAAATGAGTFASPYQASTGFAIRCPTAGAGGTATSGILVWVKEPNPVNGIVTPPILPDVNTASPCGSMGCPNNTFPVLVEGCNAQSGSACFSVENAITGAAWTNCTTSLCPWVTDNNGHDAESNIEGLATLTVANNYTSGVAVAATASWATAASGETIPVNSCAGVVAGANVMDPMVGEQNREIGQVVSCSGGVLTTSCIGDNLNTPGCVMHPSLTSTDPLVIGQLVIVTGQFPNEFNGPQTILTATASTVTFPCCYARGQVDQMSPLVVHSGAPLTYGKVAVPYIIEVCGIPYKIANCPNGEWTLSAPNVVYEDAIIDLETIHELDALHNTSVVNVAYSIPQPQPLNNQPVFQNSVVADMSGNGGPTFGYSAPGAGGSQSATQFEGSAFRTYSLVESYYGGTGGLANIALLRNVSGLSGWTDQTVDASWTSNLTSGIAGSLQLASFNAIIGLPVVPAAPAGSLYAAPHVGKGAIQPVITRQTTEPGDNLTTTPCPYNYTAGQSCMPTVAGNNETASGSWASSAVSVSIAVPNCNGVIAGMSVVDATLASPANIGFVQTCSAGSLTVLPPSIGGTIPASQGAADVLSIGEPLYEPTSCVKNYSSGGCTAFFIYTSGAALYAGPGIFQFLTGNCAVNAPGYAPSNGSLETFTGVAITAGSPTVTGATLTNFTNWNAISNYFPVGTYVKSYSAVGPTWTMSQNAVASASSVSIIVGDTAFAIAPTVSPQIAMAFLPGDWTGGNSANCGNGGATNNGTGLAVGDPAFVSAVNHTQFDKIPSVTSAASYPTPELNFFQERTAYFPENGFGPFFVQTLDEAETGTISTSGQVVTCTNGSPSVCGTNLTTTASASTSTAIVPLSVNCTADASPGAYLYDISAVSGASYPIGISASCTTTGASLVLTAPPLLPITSGDTLVIVTVPKPGNYVWVSGIGGQQFEARKIVGSAGRLNQLLVDAVFSANLSGVAWVNVNNVKDVYCVACAVGGATGYSATPSLNVTWGVDGGITGNEPIPGRYEEAAEDVVWVQSTTEGGGVYCQSTSGHCAQPYGTFFDSIVSANANHSPSAELNAVSGTLQSISTDTGAAWNTIHNSSLPVILPFPNYDGDVWTLTNNGGTFAYPGTNIALTDTVVNDANYRPCTAANWANGDSVMGCVWPQITDAAGTFIVGASYTIASVGTTNFTLLGASANTVGVVFTATGIGTGGTGAGTATLSVGNWQSSYGIGSGGVTPSSPALPSLRGYVNGPVGVGNGTPLFPFDLDGRPTFAGGYVGAQQP